MIQDILANNENIHINDKQIAILKEHFPSCFSGDGTFDIVRFQEEIKEKTEITHEGYELRFLGKSYAKLLASTDTTTVIVPNEEHNNLPENKDSENLYISGDNLDGLKHLLNSYQKQIKCIYIDPPYNTGTDGFVYNDSFDYTLEELQDKLSIDETQAKRILDLSRRGSASHSAWLMFMYPRLLLARDLLKDDGVIFISIDDNEQANLKLLCDDIFGEENLLINLIWRNGRTSSAHYAKEHEYILGYAKKLSRLPLFSFDGEDIISDRAIKKIGVKNPASIIHFPKGIDFESEDKIFPANFGTSEKIRVVEGVLEAKDGKLANDVSIEAGWTMRDMITDWLNGEVVIDQKGQVVSRFFFKNNGILQYQKEKGTIHPKSIIQNYTTKNGSAILAELLGYSDIFDFPKPPGLIADLISCNAPEQGDIVLDFFSGSASTAHAALLLSQKISRRFIAIQLPQELTSSNAAQKTAIKFLTENNLPKTLDYVGIERIKRAAAKIKEENPDKFLDLGFKHYILQEPNQNTLDKCETFDKAALISDATILDDFGPETVLTTWLNNDGYGLTASAEEIELAGYKAYYKDKHLYLIYPDFTQKALEALLSKYDADGAFNPENIILFGYSFSEWSVTEMLEKNLKILNDSEKNLKINYAVRY